MSAKKRIKEPSTWAGISGILLSAATLPVPVAQPWLVGLGAFAGAVAVFLKEGPAP